MVASPRDVSPSTRATGRRLFINFALGMDAGGFEIGET